MLDDYLNTNILECAWIFLSSAVMFIENAILITVGWGRSCIYFISFDVL